MITWINLLINIHENLKGISINLLVDNTDYSMGPTLEWSVRQTSSVVPLLGGPGWHYSVVTYILAPTIHL